MVRKSLSRSLGLRALPIRRLGKVGLPLGGALVAKDRPESGGEADHGAVVVDALVDQLVESRTFARARGDWGMSAGDGNASSR